MEDHAFDALIRSLGTALPRRTSLLGLAASLLVAPIATLFQEETAAKKKHRRKRKRKRKNKGGGGNGGCPAGQVDCGNGQCADLAADPDNCGQCGNVCAGGGCRHGACTCPSGENADCPSGCLCLDSAFDNVCFPSGTLCEDGQATCTSDDECPLGSACVNCGFAQPQRCTDSCNPA